jgi:hypothetical protein
VLLGKFQHPFLTLKHYDLAIYSGQQKCSDRTLPLPI